MFPFCAWLSPEHKLFSTRSLPHGQGSISRMAQVLRSISHPTFYNRYLAQICSVHTLQPLSACPPEGRSLHHHCTKGRGRNMPSISSPLVSLPVSSCGFTPLLAGARLAGALGCCFVALLIGKDDRKTQQPCRCEGLEGSVLGTGVF